MQAPPIIQNPLLNWQRLQLSFEDVISKDPAADGGLFIPHEIPIFLMTSPYSWKDHIFQEFALAVLSCYISPSKIFSEDLKGIIERII